MFDIFFGWRKASKCKKLIKRVQCRLKLLKNKRFTIVKQLREDLAQLIKLGYEETAFNRAEQLLNDENLMAVYDMLDQFCEFIKFQLSYICRNKDCPNDINEAVSSLIFASARCAELPELTAIRKLFGDRYGHRFVTVAVELLPGNLVNREIQEKLSVKSVSDDSKCRLIDEITRNYCLQPAFLALEYFPDLQRQGSDGSEGKSIQVDPLQFQSTADCLDDRQGRNIDRISLPRKATSSSESVPRFSEEVVVYLDDIEELQSSMRKEADCQDQRLFKFKSLSLPTSGVVVGGMDGDGETDNEKPKPRNKSRRRSFCIERSSMKDVDHEIYYENHKHKSHHGRKLHNKETLAESKEATYVLKRPKQPHRIAQKSGQCTVCVAEEIPGDKFCNCRCSSNNETRNLRRRSYDDGPSVYEVLALPRIQKETVGGSETRKGTEGPYLRAVTMPQERPREIHRYNVARSNSLSVHNPNHVHPKLPQYEDIAAKFMALKKERLLHKQ
ncbi:uncharacterized protein LOC120205763 isoform X2 [Hibiscus syriacus]|uniref:uncharacterized protein LOC120205763 isoform X2 n=1 Tax=Hibiscus syriacus TaxID=106335 RepID=UPI001920E3D8|nr:uncharacterized protein LOC120205763 isoform X2 [Hibiscus syriacus]